MQVNISESTLALKKELKFLEHALQQGYTDRDVTSLCESFLLKISLLHTSEASEAERFLLLSLAYAVVPIYNSVVYTPEIPLHLKSIIELIEKPDEY